ncbi:hypothetical protein AMTRI_Chr05g61410 [Amborella trichopoda]|uniref:2-oxoglutarate-dependent dioxygenase DAO n=1 Tax=Amborella trichopoda TaxID=13333 RepID=U5D7K8_AMBTC|nr:probable inactive 2-oxoglutarate-dependent dioxygenase AOP2 isoform X1 [Amborella trichopoda]XP_020529571.1 probable inactive 2-oxoglutarate-dependent dioxygenase AOP2 isoform X2 [Amborella trichopoda]ERN16358.1 hypothetical protein AMTR_s00052p00016200 [Amborella trichopoda]|eukprot:XP_011627268.2 probable inactive 2-oxoglutarate-dependent dioxygenase AOP2 isoform X1 [Amborella trichopoda]
MGLEVPTVIPTIDFSGDVCDVRRKVLQACEEFGCFQAVYNERVLHQVRGELFDSMIELFNLPTETKVKNVSEKPYFGYIGKSDIIPLYESLGIEHAHLKESVQSFTDLMWPKGNLQFCETVNSFIKEVWEVEGLIRRMIMEGLDALDLYESHVKSSTAVFRVMKYDAPLPPQSALGLSPHTDKNFITLVFQDNVSGLEVLSKDEKTWIPIAPSPQSFVVFIGQSFMAWSNNRLHAAQHRVMMKGDKTRFSCGLFSTPRDGMLVEVPTNLVDEKHPLAYKPFIFLDYLNYFYKDSGLKDNALQTFAGI